MNYEKMTLEKFAANLKEGRYKNLTGARRAIGKADWKETDRDKARAMAEKALPDETKDSKQSAKTPKAPKAPKVKAAKVPRVVAVVKEKTKGVRGPRKLAAPGGEDKAEGKYGMLLNPAAGLNKSGFLKVQSLHLSTQIIGAASQAINALKEAKAMDPNLDVSEAQDAVNVINKAVRGMDAVLDTPKHARSNGHANGAAPVAEVDCIDGPEDESPDMASA